MNACSTSVLNGAQMRETRHLATELKFLVTAARADQIREWARARLAPDTHGSGLAGDEYRTTSVYFDNDQLDVFHRRGSYGRAKYRIRRYGQEQLVFLERKMRTSSLLVKRRTIVALHEVAMVGQDNGLDGWDGNWFRRRLAARQLEAQVQVSYRRTARIRESKWGTIRLTLDDELRAMPVLDLDFRDDRGRPVIAERSILELKYRGAMPVVFKELVQDFSLVPARLSKYRLAIEAIRPPALPMVGHSAGRQMAHA